MKNPLTAIGRQLGELREKYLRDKYIVRFLVFIWLYSLVIAAFNDRYKLLLQSTKSEIPYYGMLMKTERGYHFYDFTNLNFDITTQDLDEEIANDVTVMPIATEELAIPKGTPQQDVALTVLKDDALLVQTGKVAKIFDVFERKSYSLLNEPNEGVAIGKTGNIYYTTVINGSSWLKIYYPACKEPSSIPLHALENGVAESMQIEGLPIQKVVRISSTEDYAVILDHEVRKNIMVVDIFQNKVTDLHVPELGEEQIHFSPTYINSTNIAFSVIGSQGNATVIYDIKNNTYTKLSSDFSDAIYVSRFGKILMAQTHNYRSGNVPFGSMSLMQAQAKIPRSDILGIVGDNDELWRRLFVDATQEFLTFKDDAKERFKVIEDPFIKRDITEYWSQIFDPFVPKEMELRIMEWNAEGSTLKENIIYSIDNEHPRLDWSFDISPLLGQLGFPDTVITMYKKNRSENPNAYQLENLQ